MRISVCLAVLCFLLQLLLHGVSAYAASYAVDLDSWLKESSPNEKHGTDVELSVKNASGDDMRAVLHYDISGIAADANISSAVAWFWVSGKDDSGDAINVHRVTANWNENSAKWNTIADDYDATVSGSFSPTNDDVWVGVDITALVQAWVCGTYTNHGVMLIATSNGIESKFASSEWSPSSQRPYLDVTVGAGSGCGPAAGHFAISHAGTNNTCSAADVTVTKHDAAHAVETSYAGTMSLATSTGNGTWSLVTGSGTLTDLGAGDATYAYAGADNGVVVLGLSNPNEETLNIDISDGAESEDASEDPDLTFSDLATQTFRDEFSTAAFDNSDGTASWSDDWQEIGESDGATAGDVVVQDHQGSDRLQVARSDNGASREANLSVFTAATLSLDYKRQNLDASEDYVAVEIFDGSGWTELTRFQGPNNDGSFQSYSEDITAFISADTQVRLLSSATLGSGDRVWFDNVEISATGSGSCSSPAVAGYELGHDGAGIHCLGEPLSATVVDVTSSVVTTYDAQVTLTTQTGRGTWALSSGSGTFVDAVADDGLATYDFDPADLGVATFVLDYPEGTSPIDVDVYQSDDSLVRDDDSEGLLTYAPTGFTLTANALTNPPPTPINDPLGPEVAGSDFPLHIAAYGVTDDDPLCGVIESYTGVRPLKFSMSYVDPGAGARVATVDGADVGNGIAQNVTFAAGQAQVTVKYKDAGEISLSAADDASFPSSLAGGSNDFVVRPAALVVSRIETAGGNANPGAASATGAQFVPAGVAFVVDVEARDAEGSITPNFGLESVPEAVLVRSNNLVLPVGGRNGSAGDVINGASFVASATSGRFTNNSVRFDEVGIIQLLPELVDADYLGAGAVAGTLTGNVGRFYPARFELVSDTLSAACVSYTYMDQPALDLDYRLQAHSSLGNVTENYDEDLLGVAAVANVTHVAEASDDGVDRGARLSAIVTEWESGEILVNEPSLAFARSASPDGPFATLQLGFQVIDGLDSVALSGLDMNPATAGDCVGAGDCDSHTLGASTRLVFGRLMVLPSFGPETRNLDVGLEAQSFNGTAFQQHQADACSVYASGLAVLDAGTYTGNLNAGETNPVAPVVSTLLVDGVDDVAAPLTLSAPGLGNDGSVELILDVPGWLEFDWFGSGDEDPAGSATFGRYRGHDRVIYWREQ